MGFNIKNAEKLDRRKLLEEMRQLEKKGALNEILDKYNYFSKIVHEITDKESAEINYIVAKVYFTRGELEKTQKIIKTVTEWCKKEKNTEILLLVECLQAVCYTAMGEYSKAEEIYNILLAKKEDLRENYYKVLTNYATVLYFSGKLRKAKELYEKAYDFALQKKLPTDQILNNLSAVLLEMGYYLKALELLEKIKQIKIEKNDLHGLVITLNHMALIYSNIGNTKEAWKNIQIAIKISEEKHFLRELAGSYSTKGLLEIRNFNFEEAVESLNKAWIILKNINVFDIISTVLFRLTLALQQLSRYDEARRVINEMENLSKKINSYFLVTYTSVARGVHYYYCKNYSKARKTFKRVIKVTRDFHQYRLFNDTLIVTAFFALFENKIRLLKRVLKFAIRNAIKLKIQHYIIFFETSLILLYLAEGKLKAAEKELNQLLKLYDESTLSIYCQQSITLLRDYQVSENDLEKREIKFKAYTKLFKILQEKTGVL